MQVYFVLIPLIPVLAFAQQAAQPAVAPNVILQSVPSNGQEIVFEVEKPARLHFPVALANRILQETVREVAWQLNPNRPPVVQMKLILRLGQNTEFFEVKHGIVERSVISMRQWNEAQFARYVARAVRSSLMSDQELDRYAHNALVRAQSQTSVAELNSVN